MQIKFITTVNINEEKFKRMVEEDKDYREWAEEDLVECATDYFKDWSIDDFTMVDIYTAPEDDVVDGFTTEREYVK